MDWSILKRLCMARAMAGDEGEIHDLILEYLPKKGLKISKDYLGSIVVRLGEGKYRFLFDAHLDEVGMMVSKIDGDGFIRFVPVGGLNADVLIGAQVVIKGKQDVIGVIGAIPPHVRAKDSQNIPQLEDLYIDTGLTKDELSEVIGVGDCIYFHPFWHEDERVVITKALDDRVGVFLLLSLIQEISEKRLHDEVEYVITFSAQEETGTKGAEAVSRFIEPDLVFVLEGTVANDVPGTPFHRMLASLRNGPEIRYSDSNFFADRELSRLISQIATRNSIRHQMIVKKAGGTNATIYQTGGRYGAITSAISVPVRYIHCPVGIANKKDIQETFKLLLSIIDETSSFIELLKKKRGL